MSPAPSAAANTRWAFKDLLTMGFSTASLIIASLGFYYSNLRVDECLVVNVAEVSYIPPGKDPKADSMKTDVFEITLVLFNTGNRPINLFEVWYHVAYKGDISEGGQGAPPVVDPTEIPVTIPSKEIRTVRLRIPRGYLAGLFDSGAPIDGDSNRRKLTWQLQFTWFDSAGKHEQVSDFIGQLRVTKDGVTHLDWPEVYDEKGAARRYPAIVLRAPREEELKTSLMTTAQH